MLAKTWGEIFVASFQNAWFGVASFIPKFVAAVIIFIIGWFVASLIKQGIAHLIDAVKLDKLLSSTGLEEVIERAGYKLNAGLFIGWLVKWFVIIVVLMISLQIVGLTQVNSFLNEIVVSFLPNVIVAALVLLVASVIADVAEKFVAGSAKAAEVRSAKMLGTVARWAIWIFAIIIALAQLGIAAQFLQVLFTGFIGMLALAGGLAFGLGGKEAASDVVEKVKDSLSHHKK